MEVQLLTVGTLACGKLAQRRNEGTALTDSFLPHEKDKIAWVLFARR